LEQPKKIKLSIVGAGNVAFNLSRIFTEKGIKPFQVLARNVKHHNDFKPFATKIIASAEELEDCEVLILAINDDAVAQFASGLKLKDTLIVHTSGTLEGDAAKSKNNIYGVFYPLQTFSKTHTPDFSEIPIFIQASDNQSLLFLKQLAKMISKEVHLSDDRTRNLLHVSAVFVSNFSHALYAIAEDFLVKESLSFKYLHPLIKETAIKATSTNLTHSLTGPAKRNDQKTIKKHLELLLNHPEEKIIYEQLTAFILNKYNPKK